MINIKETFLALTRRRYPRGTEDLVLNVFPELFKDFKKDSIGNYYLIIKKPDGSFSDTMFTSHLDTVDRGPYSYSGSTYVNNVYTPNPVKVDDKSVKHVFDGDFIKTDGETNLGADDKAGVTIILNMISENIPGLYYLFIGEESGCVGSSALAAVLNGKFDSDELPRAKKCIAFDRRGYDSVITQQMGSVCCSTDFAQALADQLNEYGFWYKPDSTGIYTDSAEFVGIIPECSNLSVGYFSEHMTSEKQDIEFLELLSIVATKIDWESLPVVRTASGSGKKRYGTTVSHYGEYDGDYGVYSRWNSRSNGGYVSPTSTTRAASTVGDTTKLIGPKTTDIDDFDFDKWYNEQKGKGYQMEKSTEEV